MKSIAPIAWLHILDNTEGIKENEPWKVLSFSPVHPFGKPGIEYSKEYTTTTIPLVPQNTEEADDFTRFIRS